MQVLEYLCTQKYSHKTQIYSKKGLGRLNS